MAERLESESGELGRAIQRDPEVDAVATCPDWGGAGSSRKGAYRGEVRCHPQRHAFAKLIRHQNPLAVKGRLLTAIESLISSSVLVTRTLRFMLLSHSLRWCR